MRVRWVDGYTTPPRSNDDTRTSSSGRANRPLTSNMDHIDRSPLRLAASTLVFLTLAVTVASRAHAEGPPKGRFAVGDSIMLSAKPELRDMGFVVNAKVGRQFGAGVWIVRHKAEDGTLAKRVVVHLGTNGTIDPADCDRLVAFAGPKRRVFLTTIKVPRSWEEPNNSTLNACANAHDKVHAIRWWSKSHDHPEWFATDGYHLNTEGQMVFASFVDRAVDRVLAGLRAKVAR